MTRKFVLFAAAMLIGMGTATAQERLGAGPVEIGAAPIGGMLFMKSTDTTEPKFGNLVFGGSVTGNVNRWIGIEGDFGYAAGRRQDLTFADRALLDQKTPSLWSYNGSLIYNPGGSDRAVVPFVAGGIGGLTMINTTETAASLGVTKNVNYLTTSVGGGIRWFVARHLGVRGDYRLLAVMRRDTAPEFFGQLETRYGHRVSGSLILTY